MRGARAATSTAAAGVAMLLLGGCDDGGDAARAPTTVETTTSTTATTPTSDPAEGRCSAAGLDPDVEPQPGLPQAVADIRQQIVTAAVACDYEALEALAADGELTYSFGDDGDPSSFWRRREAERGGDLGPLGFLAGILDRPHGVEEHDGTVRYVWPSAFSYPTWSDVPEADRAALEPLYGDDDLESFARFGAYLGHRVVIEEDGTWTAFVAGD